MFSGEDVDSRRLSQIFESLSCWNDLKNLETTISTSSGSGGQLNASSSGGVGSGTVGSNGSSQNDLQFMSANNSNSSSSPQSTSNPSTLFHPAKRSSTGGALLFQHNQSSPNHQQVVTNTIPPPSQHNLRHHLGHVTSRSTPNSPRMVPRRAQSTAAAPGGTATSSSSFGPESSPWLNLANLTEYLDVHQMNNYQQNLPEINWQERCLELQLELHRSKTQAGRFQNRLREKLNDVEKKLFETEERADLAEVKVRSMEKQMTELPKRLALVQKQQQQQASSVDSSSNGGGSSSHASPSKGLVPCGGSVTDTDKTINCLEQQVEEQKLLRIQDARQVEAKAAKIKEWVTNKLRELEDQNQLLREQNVKCNQQLELLRKHVTSQSSIKRHTATGTPPGTLAQPTNCNFAEVQRDYSNLEAAAVANRRRRSESLDTPGTRPLSGSPQRTQQKSHKHHRNHSQSHQQHRRNLSMEGHELARDLAEAVDGLHLVPMPAHLQRPPKQQNVQKEGGNEGGGHDYAEIYTPSQEKLPQWLQNELSTIGTGTGTITSGTGTLGSTVSGGTAASDDINVEKGRPPTPPLHRFPSWEAKIYQVANNALVGNETDSQEVVASGTGTGSRENGNTMSAGYCDINVPVYATVKGRASQIRSIPFTGESSDDDEESTSDAEENAMMVCTATYGSHNSSNTDNTETSMSGSSSSPSRSMKTSPSLSPGKQNPSTSHPAIVAASPKYLPARRDMSFESGMSDDYAIPPDAAVVVSHMPPTAEEPSSLVSVSGGGAASTAPVPVPCMNMSMQSLLMRSSFADSPLKKVETLEKMGTLSKLGGKLKTWQKRYFVLKNGSLTYYKSQSDVGRKPQGQFVIDEECRISKVEGAPTFEINTSKKTYYLTADSNAVIEDWVRVLQNVQKRNAAKLLLLNKNDQQHKPTIQGWATKVKNGHSKKCWCVLFGKQFLYFKQPEDATSLGQINMRDCRVDEVEHVSDSDSEEREDPAQSQARLTVAINPTNQGPTYLIFATKQERDNWLYHLTVVSSVGPNAGSQYEQIVQKLMETDGDPNCMLWRHPILQYTKDAITSPLSSLGTEVLQSEALKLFKCCHLFMTVQVNQLGIDYHVVLAQNALQQCLDMPELVDEFVCALVKQTTRLTGQKTGVQVNKKLGKQTKVPIIPVDCKSNPPTYTFVQGWQLLALAVSLFVPKNNRLLWYLKLHLSRNADSKTDCGKYAAYCERALARTLINGGRETKPSRMEVLSILLKNPYHHSLPHAIPVHMMNGSYQVVSFDGSTTIEEFLGTLTHEIGCRDAGSNGFTLFSDDPIERDLEHYLDPEAKLCDVISKWETALREKGSGKFENSKVIQLTFKSRLYNKVATRVETDKERLLLCYQTNAQIVQGRFPLSRELALELASLMAQIDMGDYVPGADVKGNSRHSCTLQSNATTSSGSTSTALQALDRFYPYRYRDAMVGELKELHETLAGKWSLLKGKSTLDCVRIYLTCCRKWPFFGASLFQAKPRNSEQGMTWLAVSEEAISILELASMMPVSRFSYGSIVTFGGCQDDFMLVVSAGADEEQKLLFAMSKPKILEVTLLIADYMNALGHAVPGTPQMNTLTRNGSYRSRSRQQNNATTTTTAAVTAVTGSNACNTLNSFASHTLNSQHSHSLGGGGGEPDILRSTPDHHHHHHHISNQHHGQQQQQQGMK